MKHLSKAKQNFAQARALLLGWKADDPERSFQIRLARRAGAPLPEEGSGPARADVLLQAAAKIAAGKLKAVDLVKQALRAAEKHHAMNAMVYVAATDALHQAEVLDEEAAQGNLRGPLHGIPVTVKDVIHVRGMPTRAGSDAYNAEPRKDATAVSRLRSAGAIILGKATTHEFALGITTPQCKNPVDPTRIPGGSSGGSAIAVAMGIGLASLGTDTRGSTRIPAALSGVVGFKATFGAVPAEGLVPVSWSMDHAAPLTKTVADAAVVLDVLMARRGRGGPPGSERRRPLTSFAGAPVKGLRIGVPEAAFEGCHPEVAAAVRNAIDALGELGCEIIPVARPNAHDFVMANAAGLIVSRSEAASYHRALHTNLEYCWAEIRDQLEEAQVVHAHEYVKAQRLRAEMAEHLGAMFEQVDAIASPTSLLPAPPVETAHEFLMTLARNSTPWSFVGFPALSLPCRDRAEGLPVGLQLVAPPFEEATLVAMGTAYERAR